MCSTYLFYIGITKKQADQHRASDKVTLPSEPGVMAKLLSCCKATPLVYL